MSKRLDHLERKRKNMYVKTVAVYGERKQVLVKQRLMRIFPCLLRKALLKL